ncbi:MAG: alpha/beta fold hydrolase [candidate division WOR-3 bacterium]
MTPKRRFILVSFIFFSTALFASDVPIIFIHGHCSEARPEGTNEHPDWKDKGGWGTWYPRKRDGSFDYHTAMTKIIDSHYGGYTAGEPLNCDKNSNLSSTGTETRKIYNFSYYNPDGSRGAIGTNGRLWPTSEASYLVYQQNVNNACWAKHLADFIDKVLVATGAQKVDIVAHSMGGLVAHSAIKYYGCASKVRKLLMIGTPNHGFSHWMEFFYYYYSNDQWWQWNGENLEMNVGDKDWYFKDEITGETDIWCDLLGYGNEGVQISTIAGNRKTSVGTLTSWPNDGLVVEYWVKMGSSAQFEPTIYASHSYDGEPEVALTACTYTEEFIKNWMIDDNTMHNGTPVAGVFATYYSGPFNGSRKNYESGFRLPVNDYNKSLAHLLNTGIRGSKAESFTPNSRVAAVVGAGFGMLFSTEFITGINLETPGTLFAEIRYWLGSNIVLAMDYIHIFRENSNVLETKLYLPLVSEPHLYSRWSIGGGLSYYHVRASYEGEVTNPYTQEKKWVNVAGSKGELGWLLGVCYEIKIGSIYLLNFGVDLRFIRPIQIKYNPDVGCGFQPAGTRIELGGSYPFVSFVVNLW